MRKNVQNISCSFSYVTKLVVYILFWFIQEQLTPKMSPITIFSKPRMTFFLFILTITYFSLLSSWVM